MDCRGEEETEEGAEEREGGDEAKTLDLAVCLLADDSAEVDSEEAVNNERERRREESVFELRDRRDFIMGCVDG